MPCRFTGMKIDDIKRSSRKINETERTNTVAFDFLRCEKYARNSAYVTSGKKKIAYLATRKKSHEEASHIIQQPETKPSVTVLNVN